MHTKERQGRTDRDREKDLKKIQNFLTYFLGNLTFTLRSAPSISKMHKILSLGKPIAFFLFLFFSTSYFSLKI